MCERYKALMPENFLDKTFISRAAAKPGVQILLILLTGFLAYANTFNVPFIFDDNRVILDNHLIKNLGNFWPPSGARWFGSLTFAINYAVGDLQVSGYHYVNLAIHLASSLLVYRLVLVTFSTPLFLRDKQASAGITSRAFVPFLASFLFVAHPIQTQAVTYIVQRYASLATLFFLAATVCYIQARLLYADCPSDHRTRACRVGCWYVAALLSAVLAMKTKEIAFTLPFVIALYEYTFLPGRPLMERLRFFVPIGLTLLIIPFTLSRFGPDGVFISSSAADISRHDYLLTQFRVIVTYLRLLIVPVNQMFDYVTPLLKKLSDPAVFLSLGLLSMLLLAGLMFLVIGRRGKTSPWLCIVGFGILWFFITLSVESSIIPIMDVMFEHRLYLPSAGFFMAAAVAGSVAVERLVTRFPQLTGIVCALVVATLIALPIATHSRNKVWRSELSLWEDVMTKSTGNARAHAIVGAELVERGGIDRAIELLQEAIRLKPDYADAIICLGNAYMNKGMLEEGYQQFLKAFALGNMDIESRAELLRNIGNYNFRKGDTDRAIAFYLNALAITPSAAMIHFDLGRAYKRKGMVTEAVHAFERARQLNTIPY